MIFYLVKYVFFFSYLIESNVANLYIRNDACLIRSVNSGEVLSEFTLRRWLGPKIKDLWMYNTSAVVEFMNEKQLKNLLFVSKFYLFLYMEV